MRYVSHVVAITTLAGAVAACAAPYYPRYGYSQGYYSAYPASYSYYPPPTYSYAYSYPPSYAYRSSGDYYRNYNGIHTGSEY